MCRVQYDLFIEFFMQYKWFKLNLRLLYGFQYIVFSYRFLYISLSVDPHFPIGSFIFFYRFINIFLSVSGGVLVPPEKLIVLFFLSFFSIPTGNFEFPAVLGPFGLARGTHAAMHAPR